MPGKNKYRYTYHYEVICKCSKCNNEHLRKDRIKQVPEEESFFLCIRVCPKCKAEGYIPIGEKEFRRRVKNE